MNVYESRRSAKWVESGIIPDIIDAKEKKKKKFSVSLNKLYNLPVSVFFTAL